MRDWLKLAGLEEAGKDRKAEKLWRVEESEKVGSKAGKKLIAGDRKCFKRVRRSRTNDCVGEWCVAGAKDLRFIGREFHKRDELRNEQSANLSLVETGGMERHRWSEERVLPEGLIFMSLRRYFGSDVWRRLCVMEMLLY